MKKYSFFAILFILLSCNRDHIFETNPTHLQLLKNVYLDGEILFSFEYNDDNKIQSQISLTNGGISNVAFFEYSNDTIYKTISGFYSSKSKSYLISPNTIKLLEYDNENNLLFSYLNFYSSNNCGLSRTESYTKLNDLYIITEFEYLDSNCSYTSEQKLFNGTKKNNYTVFKDDKNNYKASVNPWSSFEKKHNVIEYKQRDKNGNISLNNSYNSRYIYDENYYPIQETRIFLSGATKIYTYEYY
jgi:hypothetical protein